MIRRRGTGRRGAARGSQPRGDRGATVVELALIMPLVLAVVLLIVQVALWFHGRQVADAAAREGARIARAAGPDATGWEGEAEERARSIVRAIGPSVLADAQATAWEEDDRRGVEVTGRAVQVIPLLPDLTFTVTARSGGPVECFRPDDGSGGCL